MQNLKMTLLENSTSFFVESVSKAVAAETEQKEWKFATLLLVQAIETVLKERLRRENEVFVYSNIDKPKHTVDIALSLDRLHRICNLKLNEKDISSIKTASEIRNQIVHFKFDLSLDQIKSVFTKLVEFYTSFCEEHLGTEIKHYLPSDLRNKLLNLETYVSELLKRAEEKIERNEIPEEYVWQCSACGNFTFIIEDAKNTCILCDHSEEVIECTECGELIYEEDALEIYSGNYKRLHHYDYVCSDCAEKYNVDPHEHYY